MLNGKIQHKLIGNPSRVPAYLESVAVNLHGFLRWAAKKRVGKSAQTLISSLVHCNRGSCINIVEIVRRRATE